MKTTPNAVLILCHDFSSWSQRRDAAARTSGDRPPEQRVPNHPLQDESPEVPLRRESVGFSTAAASNLLVQLGYIRPGMGTDKLTDRLNIRGKPSKTNYTVVGGALYVEAINADGTAQLFAVPMEPATTNREREGIDPIATYATVRIDAIYKRSPEYLGLDDKSVKLGGELPTLLMEQIRTTSLSKELRAMSRATSLQRKTAKSLPDQVRVSTTEKSGRMASQVC